MDYASWAKKQRESRRPARRAHVADVLYFEKTKVIVDKKPLTTPGAGCLTPSRTPDRGVSPKEGLPMAKEKKSTRRAAGKKAFRTRVRKAKAAGKKSIKVGNRRVKITHALSGAKRRKDSGPNFGGVRRKKRRGGRKAKAEASPVRRKRRKSGSHKRRSTPRTKHHHHTKVITKRRTVEVK